MTDTTREVASNLVLLVPEAQPAVDLCNAGMPLSKRLTAPAHITLVYPFMPPSEVEGASADLRAFFADLSPLRFTLDVGWFGREVLLLRPSPDDAMIELTERVIARWPDFPYYGGQYDTIDPHLSLAFGDAASLDPLAATVNGFTPMAVAIQAVTLLTGPHEAMTTHVAGHVVCSWGGNVVC